jgi:hypothetical protein
MAPSNVENRGWSHVKVHSHMGNTRKNTVMAPFGSLHTKLRKFARLVYGVTFTEKQIKISLYKLRTDQVTTQTNKNKSSIYQLHTMNRDA